MKLLSWKTILRIISILSLLVAAGWAYFEPGFEPVLAVLGAIAAFITSFFVDDASLQNSQLPADVTLYDIECGSKGVNLADQRLRVSAAFGAYFTGLLERDQSYIPLSGQIDCPTHKGQEALPPIQRIFWSLQNPKGARTIILAAEGGMGKSTLASKLIRCLYDQEAVDMILGDSAKSEHVDPVSGELLSYTPGYQNISSFYERLCTQLGVPYENNELALSDIRRRLVNRRAVIVVDNLESVTRGDQLMRALQKITSRDIRAIVTTRKVSGIDMGTSENFFVRLNPLQEPAIVSEFLNWHLDQFQHTHLSLSDLRHDLADKRQINWLIERSGGIPLLMQLLISDVARSSWEQVRRLPTLFGTDLLNFLYETRWQELKELGESGLLAREMLRWLQGEQFDNKRITAKRLSAWAQAKGKANILNVTLSLLYERFLIINSDPQKGNYSIFPSLSEFLTKHG